MEMQLWLLLNFSHDSRTGTYSDFWVHQISPTWCVLYTIQKKIIYSTVRFVKMLTTLGRMQSEWAPKGFMKTLLVILCSLHFDKMTKIFIQALKLKQ